MAEGVVIRPEREDDHVAIAEVIRAAFAGRSDEVASFVERIRASAQFVPELALVAEDSSGVVGHVVLSWVGVEGGSRDRILNLTPMSVRPDRQRIGVGARLIREALDRAEGAGEPAVMVEGIAAYYPRFGFERASALGFIAPHPTIPDEAFMVKRLPGYRPELAGRIVYPAAFDALGYGRHSVAGELVTEELAYDGGRPVTVYVPPDPPEAVVFAGDGQVISRWGAALEGATVPPVMIVGAHRVSDETLRLREYSPGFDPDRFAAHETFFVEGVRRWAGTRFGVRLPADRTAVCGVSASGELALAVGLRHPEVYGAVFCASPGGGYRPPGVMPNTLPRTYLVAGTREPFFRENAVRWAEALRDAGADVVMAERVGSHGDPFWREEFPVMVAWAFGPARMRP